MKRIKVSTREIILVAAMLAAVLYGAYDFFVVSSPNPSGTGSGGNAAQMDALIAEASKVLEEGGSYPVYAAVVEGTETGWERDPFYAGKAPVVSASTLGSVAYTGYLEIGARRIAVIDGVSYEIGNELEVGGYRVKRIASSSVVIEETGTGKNITVPLLEE